MGKKLVVKGADFSQNAIDEIIWTDISSNLLFSSTKRQYLHYPHDNVNDAFQYVSNITSVICYVDVSSYVGRRIKLHIDDHAAASGYTGGAYWTAFASSINVTMPPTGTTAKVQNAITPVEHISGTGHPKEPVDLILLVPQGATYLVTTCNPSLVTPALYLEQG